MLKYQAFISYSRASSDTALDLHQKLESYVVPKVLRGRETNEAVIGKTLGVFFIDRAELSATPHLEDEVKHALSASKFLIVLCTPEAAGGIWVPLEIEFFKKLGRKANILPVLVEGKPEIFDPTTAPNGAFPRALFDTQVEGEKLPLAPDIRDPEEDNGDGFEVAFLRIVARLLGVRFPEMTQRHLVAEKQKRQFRNRVIGALALMLLLAVTGGTLAWHQKQAADKRLAQALESASRQVHLAKNFRARYGIPSSISHELFSSAADDFSSIVSEAGDNPDLLLNRARYNLGMAELVADVEGSELSSYPFLQQASRDIDTAQTLSDKWYATFWFHRIPETAQMMREKVNMLDLSAKYSAAGQSAEAALRFGEEAVALSDLLKQKKDVQQTVSLDTVFSKCALSDIHYRLGKRLHADAAYDACLNAAEKLWKSQPHPESRSILVNALIDYGMILRLKPGQVLDATRLHERALEMARSVRKDAISSNDEQLLLATALVSYSDTLNLAAVPLEDQLTLYQEAGGILKDLIESDPNRKDWKQLRSLAAYREAGIYARQAMAYGQVALLRKSQAVFSDGVNLLEALVRRFPDDPSLARDLSAFYENRAEIYLLRLEKEGGNSLKSQITDDLDSLFELRNHLMKSQRDNKMFARDLANAHLVRARFGLRLEAPPEQIEFQFAEARKIFLGLESDPDFQPNIHRDLAVTDFEEAKLWYVLGMSEKACKHARSAHEHMKQLMDTSESNKKNKRDNTITSERAQAYCAN